MPRIQKSKMSLRLVGDDLDPDEISAKLGCEPDWKQRKNEIVVGNNGRSRIAKFGMWSLWAEVKSPGDLDLQASEIFSRMVEDIEVWKPLSSEFRIVLFCGIYVGGYNGGVPFSPENLLYLGERGVKLDLDIYSKVKD